MPESGNSGPGDSATRHPPDGEIRLTRRALRRLYAVIVLLAVLALSVTAAWWFTYVRLRPKSLDELWPDESRNEPASFHEDVDFTKVYPGFTREEIETIQRQTFGVFLLYESYTEFRMAPVKSPYVNVSQNGYRIGRSDPPWPPKAEDFTVFCYGGSTMFGHGVPDLDTFPVALEEALQERLPDRHVVCYNFGRAYYQSTQERILYEQHLLNGFVPDMALFMNGVNDFFFSNGATRGQVSLFKALTPKVEPPPVDDLSTDESKATATRNTLIRIRRNQEIAQLTGIPFNIQFLFIGHPVPSHRFTRDPALYPFGKAYFGHELCDSAYPEYERAALAGELGPRFIWAGDAFETAAEPMYVDSIHYSRAGNQTLARDVVKKAFAKGLVK